MPLNDQYTAIALYLELAIQRGLLSSVLEAVLLLISLSEKKQGMGNWPVDNQVAQQLQLDGETREMKGRAPLLPFIKRLEGLSPQGNAQSSQRKESVQDSPRASPTALFLKYLQLPNDENTVIDVKQAAVILLSHIDRLATPFYPANNKKAVVGTAQFSACCPFMTFFSIVWTVVL